MSNFCPRKKKQCNYIWPVKPYQMTIWADPSELGWVRVGLGLHGNCQENTQRRRGFFSLNINVGPPALSLFWILGIWIRHSWSAGLKEQPLSEVWSLWGCCFFFFFRPPLLRAKSKLLGFAKTLSFDVETLINQFGLKGAVGEFGIPLRAAEARLPSFYLSVCAVRLKNRTGDSSLCRTTHSEGRKHHLFPVQTCFDASVGSDTTETLYCLSLDSPRDCWVMISKTTSWKTWKLG